MGASQSSGGNNQQAPSHSSSNFKYDLETPIPTAAKSSGNNDKLIALFTTNGDDNSTTHKQQQYDEFIHKDLVYVICKFLNFRQALRLATVSKAFRQLICGANGASDAYWLFVIEHLNLYHDTHYKPFLVMLGDIDSSTSDSPSLLKQRLIHNSKIEQFVNTHLLKSVSSSSKSSSSWASLLVGGFSTSTSQQTAVPKQQEENPFKYWWCTREFFQHQTLEQHKSNYECFLAICQYVKTIQGNWKGSARAAETYVSRHIRTLLCSLFMFYKTIITSCLQCLINSCRSCWMSSTLE